MDEVFVADCRVAGAQLGDDSLNLQGVLVPNVPKVTARKFRLFNLLA